MDTPESVTLRFSPEAAEAVKRLSEAQEGATISDVIRRALGTDIFLLEARERGCRILIQETDGEIFEVVTKCKEVSRDG